MPPVGQQQRGREREGEGEGEGEGGSRNLEVGVKWEGLVPSSPQAHTSTVCTAYRYPSVRAICTTSCVTKYCRLLPVVPAT